MGIHALSSALAGFVTWLPLMTATAIQLEPPCAPAAALLADTRQSLPHVTLVRDRIGTSGLKSAEIRSRLAELGYQPSVLDRYLDTTCSVPTPTDSVRLALQALGLVRASEWDAQSGLEQSRGEVTIAGEVARPGNVPFREGMTLGDLITEVGRLKPTADLTVEIYRVMKSVDGERQPIPEIHSIRVDSAYLVNRDANRLYAKHIAGFTHLVDRAAAFKLMPYDRVVVKRRGGAPPLHHHPREEFGREEFGRRGASSLGQGWEGWGSTRRKETPGHAMFRLCGLAGFSLLCGPLHHGGIHAGRKTVT